MERSAVDLERLKEFSKRVFGTMQGAVTAGMLLGAALFMFGRTRRPRAALARSVRT